MIRWFKTTSLLFPFLLAGCSAMFVAKTADPYKKLSQAQDLLAVNRPLPAEQLSLEALTEFKEKNDRWGIAQAYGVLGLVYRSPAIAKWEKHYREKGFLETSVTYDNRFEKALSYLEQAEKIFTEFEYLSTTIRAQLKIANLYDELKRTPEACSWYRKALATHRENVEKNPGVKVPPPAGFASFEEGMEATLEKLHCD